MSGPWPAYGWAGLPSPTRASKAALHQQTRLLAAVLGPEVRVNAVAPGLVDTPWTADWHELKAGVRAIAPMRRVVQPEDVAHVVLAQVTSEPGDRRDLGGRQRPQPGALTAPPGRLRRRGRAPPPRAG